MWYIKKTKNVPKYLSVFGGWRKKENLHVSMRDPSIPLIIQWKSEIAQFPTQREANAKIKEKELTQAIPVNGIV